jgi:hypothetical protein
MKEWLKLKEDMPKLTWTVDEEEDIIIKDEENVVMYKGIKVNGGQNIDSVYILKNQINLD